MWKSGSEGAQISTDYRNQSIDSYRGVWLGISTKDSGVLELGGWTPPSPDPTLSLQPIALDALMTRQHETMRHTCALKKCLVVSAAI